MKTRKEILLLFNGVLLAGIICLGLILPVFTIKGTVNHWSATLSNLYLYGLFFGGLFLLAFVIALVAFVYHWRKENVIQKNSLLIQMVILLGLVIVMLIPFLMI